MLFLGDFGGRTKRIGNFGIHKCLNCNNWQPQGVYEVSKQIRAFFIPLARWDKQIYVICPICKAGFPPKADRGDDLLRESALMPDDQTAQAIWDELDTFTAAFLDKSPAVLGAEEMLDWHRQVMELMGRTEYRKEHINRVLLSFTQYFGELLEVKKTQK